MQITSPEDVMNFLDRNPHLVGASMPWSTRSSSDYVLQINHPAGSSMPPPDWHPRPSAQYAAVAAIVWPESANRGQGSRIETHSNRSVISISSDEYLEQVAGTGNRIETHSRNRSVISFSSNDDLEREVASKGKGKESYDKRALEIIDLTAD